MKKHSITIAFLVAAIVFYAFGWRSAGAIFIALGLLCESIFWFRLFRRKRHA